MIREVLAQDPLLAETRSCSSPAPSPTVSGSADRNSSDSGNGSLRWLGALFDRKLGFRPHALSTIQKAHRTADALHLLGDRRHGALASSLLQAAVATVVAGHVWAAEAWWRTNARAARGLATRADKALSDQTSTGKHERTKAVHIDHGRPDDQLSDHRH